MRLPDGFDLGGRAPVEDEVVLDVRGCCLPTTSTFDGLCAAVPRVHAKMEACRTRIYLVRHSTIGVSPVFLLLHDVRLAWF